MGANADVRAEHIQQFAIMGSIYAQSVLGIEQPTVRILSNGEEAGKGNQLVIAAFKLLEETPASSSKATSRAKRSPRGWPTSW